jgi:hypothetical protein
MYILMIILPTLVPTAFIRVEYFFKIIYINLLSLNTNYISVTFQVLLCESAFSLPSSLTLLSWESALSLALQRHCWLNFHSPVEFTLYVVIILSIQSVSVLIK